MKAVIGSARAKGAEMVSHADAVGGIARSRDRDLLSCGVSLTGESALRENRKSGLTAARVEVLRHALEGYTCAGIARRIGRSQSRVREQLASLVSIGIIEPVPESGCTVRYRARSVPATGVSAKGDGR